MAPWRSVERTGCVAIPQHGPRQRPASGPAMRVATRAWKRSVLRQALQSHVSVPNLSGLVCSSASPWSPSPRRRRQKQRPSKTPGTQVWGGQSVRAAKEHTPVPCGWADLCSPHTEPILKASADRRRPSMQCKSPRGHTQHRTSRRQATKSPQEGRHQATALRRAKYPLGASVAAQQERVKTESIECDDISNVCMHILLCIYWF